MNGRALLMVVAGGALAYTGVTSATGNPKVLLRELLAGKTPAAPSTVPAVAAAGTAGAAGGAASAAGGDLLTIAASFKGQCYVFGAGHSGIPCASTCTDCSSYVSCCLSKAGLTDHVMATGELATFGQAVVYSQRQPGDLIVWNGGAGGGHCGIIAGPTTMWNNPCTLCGGVQVSGYPSMTRTAAAAIIRRP